MMERLVKNIFFCLCLGLGFVRGFGYERYVNEIVNSFAKDMKKEYGLICIGSGGRMPKNVEEIKTCFYLYRRTSLEEARQLIVILKEELVARVNAHEKIRPFLQEYPFTLARADVSIAFHKPKSNNHYLDGSIAFVCSANWGKEISYNRAEIQTRRLPGVVNFDGSVVMPEEFREQEVLVPVLRETCEEAARIVHSKSKDTKQP